MHKFKDVNKFICSVVGLPHLLHFRQTYPSQWAATYRHHLTFYSNKEFCYMHISVSFHRLFRSLVPMYMSLDKCAW